LSISRWRNGNGFLLPPLGLRFVLALIVDHHDESCFVGAACFVFGTTAPPSTEARARVAQHREDAPNRSSELVIEVIVRGEFMISEVRASIIKWVEKHVVTEAQKSKLTSFKRMASRERVAIDLVSF
jgi:hypothetical protein